MSFEPEPGMSIPLGNETLQFTSLQDSGPAATFVYAEAGKEGVVYKVLKARKYYALKVFYPEYQDKRLLKNTEKLSQFKDLEGFRVAERTVISRKSFPDVVEEFPELNYSVLMPWIQGTLWGNLMLEESPLPREKYLHIANLLIRAVHGLETRGLAHCDLSNNNFIIDPKLSSIQLIDIEDMYAPDMPRPIPDISFGTPGYRTKWIAQNGLWSPESDRFGSAILCSEILTWHDEKIRQSKAGNSSFFEEAEIGEKTERYRLMQDSLRRVDEDLPALFEKVWLSERPDQCPPVANWMSILQNIESSLAPVTAQTDPQPDKSVSKRRDRSPKSDQMVQNNTPPRLQISHSILDFGILREQEVNLEFWISNTGGSILTGSLAPVTWMKISPSEFSIPSGKKQLITASISLSDKLPAPKSGHEYRIPHALMVESNAGDEVIGASYKLATPSLYKNWLASLIAGLFIILFYGFSSDRLSSTTDLLWVIYFGVVGLLAGLAAKNIRNFRNYQDILKVLGINALVVLSAVVLSTIVDSYIDDFRLFPGLISNSIVLTLLMMVFARNVRPDAIEVGKKIGSSRHGKTTKRDPARTPRSRRSGEQPARKTDEKSEAESSSTGFLDVFIDDGTPLYSSLPASNNWIVWLDKGSQLSTVEPLEDVMSSLKKYGYYIEVIDKDGNRGFVTATAVKIKYS